jgi:hypothetical protein
MKLVSLISPSVLNFESWPRLGDCVVRTEEKNKMMMMVKLSNALKTDFLPNNIQKSVRTSQETHYVYCITICSSMLLGEKLIFMRTILNTQYIL